MKRNTLRGVMAPTMQRVMEEMQVFLTLAPSMECSECHGIVSFPDGRKYETCRCGIKYKLNIQFEKVGRG